MAEERPSAMKIEFAMADVLGLFIIALFTWLVAGNALNANDGAVVAAVALPVGLVTLMVAYVAYHNNNLLGTGIFGPLAAFFLSYFMLNVPGFLVPAATGVSVAMLLAFIGIVILIDAIVAMYQPVRLLPILLFIAAIAFFATALNANSPSSGMKGAVGVLWMIYTLLSLYMAPAIMILVMKGKDMLPLMIAKAKPAKANP